MDTSGQKVAVLLGSLRSGSVSGGIAAALGKMQPESLKLGVVDISKLEMYDPDLEDATPESWRVFRETIGAADAILFISPEFNRSVPAVLKNAIDVGSRPFGKSVWQGKPAAIITHSPGALGGFGANHHLRQTLTGLNVASMPAPEAYLSQSAKLLDESGSFRPEVTPLMENILTSFARWIGRMTYPY